MPAPATRPSLDSKRFRWDVVLFLAFVLAAMRHWTDLPVHELIGLAAIPVLGVHLWLNWSWIVDVLRRPATTLRGEVRFNRAWDVAQSIVAFIALGSGLLASRHLLKALGDVTGLRRPMDDIHTVSSWVLMVMIGVHLGTHLPWVGAKLRRPRFAFTAVLLALAVGAATRLAVFRDVGAFRSRFQGDLTKVILALVPATLVAFSVLMVRRRRRVS